MSRFLNSVRVPLLLLLLLVIFETLSRLGILPSSREISSLINDLLDTYGLIIIGPLAFFENLAAFNAYFPGSIVILTTMALSAGNPTLSLNIFLVYYVFAVLAYHIDYFIGKGLNANRIQGLKLSSPDMFSKKNLLLRFLILFSHPQLASVLCVQLGSENQKYSQFINYLLLFTFLWTLFWSIVMYSIGTLGGGAGVDLKIFAYIYLSGLFIYDLYKYLKQQSK